MDPQDPLILCLLDDFKEGVLTCLSSTLIALYVYGSLVTDDFIPQKSDIDFLAIVTRLPEHAHCLERMHHTLAETHAYGKTLEGDYIPLSQLSSRGGSGTCFGFYEGAFNPNTPGDMISCDNIMALRTKSIVLYGPHPCELLPDVRREEMRAYMLGLLTEYREYRSNDPEKTSSEILNMCRSWHATLHHEILSKTEAAVLAMERFPRWAALIRKALEVRSGVHTPSTLEGDLQKFAETLLEDIDSS